MKTPRWRARMKAVQKIRSQDVHVTSGFDGPALDIRGPDPPSATRSRFQRRHRTCSSRFPEARRCVARRSPIRKKNSVVYNVAVQTPQAWSIAERWMNMPVAATPNPGAGNTAGPLLGNLR
jgi:hypothetical protein